VTAILFVACVILGVLLSDVRSRQKRLDILFNEVLNRLTQLERDGGTDVNENAVAPARASALRSAGPAIIVSEPTDIEPVVPSRPLEPEALTEPQPIIQEPVVEAVPDIKPVAPQTFAESESFEPEQADARPQATPIGLPKFSLPKFSLPKVTLSFEQLVGGKLPIWVGGAALVLAAFFLVRYSIEQGLLGPGVRTMLAAAFGVALIAASEAARRIPRFADDPRVGQSLAGAGIASLYGTLYMATETYGLIAPTVAFVLMATVTAAALFLSLRHGPPTAIMGLIGGFVAPFMAAPSGDLVPLIVYLGLLIAGLFAVAIHRGWMWLALAATGGGVAWTLGIIAADLTGIGPSLGFFIVVLALGATLFLPKSGVGTSRVRLVPMVAGFIQLALFAPAIDFGVTAWGLYAVLSAASLYLGWRDDRLMPACLAALSLVLILLFSAFTQDKAFASWAAIGATLLFAIPGHVFARRPHTDRNWTALALVGSMGPLLVAWATDGPALLGSLQWAALFWGAAVVQASLSWRARGEGRMTGTPDWALTGGGIGAAAMAAIALYLRVDNLWMTVALFGVSLVLSLWARQVMDRTLQTYGALITALGLFLWFWLATFAKDIFPSIVFNAAPPAAEHLAALLIVPALLLAALAWVHRGLEAAIGFRWISLVFALAIPLSLVPALWHPATALAMALPLALWARRGADHFGVLESIACMVVAGWFWLAQLVLHDEVALSIFADGAVPERQVLLALLVSPGALLTGLAWLHRGRMSDQPVRWIALGFVMAVLLALVPALWHTGAMLTGAVALGLMSRRDDNRFWWQASLALLAGGAAYWIFAISLRGDLGLAVFLDGARPDGESIAALLGVPALLLAGSAWAHRGRAWEQPLRWQAMGLLVATVLAIVPYDWHPPVLAGFVLAAIASDRRLPWPLFAREGLLVTVSLSLLVRLAPFALIVVQSIAGETTHFGMIPPLQSAVISLGFPVALLTLGFWMLRNDEAKWQRQGILAAVGLAGVALLYALIKQPFAIATPEQFLAHGFIERAIITQALFVAAVLLAWRGGTDLRRAVLALAGLALARFAYFDLFQLNPVLVAQNVGANPLANAATAHFGLTALWLWLAARRQADGWAKQALRFATLGAAAIAVAITVRQAFQGGLLNDLSLPKGENYGYSVAFLLLALLWLWRGIAGQAKWLRVTGLALLTLVTLKVFLIDAAALGGLLRVFSFLGLGGALIGIGWAYGRFVAPPVKI
jgi:uncharacterized membrane protein